MQSRTIDVLIIEDDEDLALFLKRAMNVYVRTGLKPHTVSSLRDAFALSQARSFGVILLDLNLPDSRGLDTLSEARKLMPDIPVVVLTGVKEDDFGLSVIQAGAQDYLIKGEAEPSLIVKSLIYAVERQELMMQNRRSAEDLAKSYERVNTIMNGIIGALDRITEARDPYTAGHQRQVAELAKAIAGHMGLSEERVNGIFISAVLHDIGKIYVPAEILTKPGRLSELEYSMMKNHSQVGYEILRSINFPWPVADIVLSHHEREDGSGYPNGSHGGEILLDSGIIAVADVVEAMSHHRPYRCNLGMSAALEEIQNHAGARYKKDVVRACVDLINTGGFAF